MIKKLKEMSKEQKIIGSFVLLLILKLAKAVDKTKATVYYLDSEHIDKTSWNSFKTNVGFKTIPNLTYFTNSTAYDRLSNASQASVEVIESFIRKK